VSCVRVWFVTFQTIIIISNVQAAQKVVFLFLFSHALNFCKAIDIASVALLCYSEFYKSEHTII
jgi:hypothetical protein